MKNENSTHPRTLDAHFPVRELVVAITGGGGALCGEMAEALGALGARIAVLDRDTAAAEACALRISAEGGDAIAVGCDVLDESSLRTALDQICEHWDTPDVLINGAGGNHPSGTTTESCASTELLSSTPIDITSSGQATFFDLPLDGFRGVLDLNFMGTVAPCKIFGQRMAARGRGSIINMSSMSALTPLTRVGSYSAAKAAVANVTRWLAVHLAPVGVRVNALAPGFFMTEQLRFLHVDQATGQFAPRAAAVVAHTPMNRYGRPNELVGAVIWLCTDASSFVTGTVLPIDGGFSSYSI